MRAVFAGEVDKGKVSGFHNWIAFQAQEAAGRLNYLGHLLPRGRCASSTDLVQSERQAACCPTTRRGVTLSLPRLLPGTQGKTGALLRAGGAPHLLMGTF